jgi:outer membrane protein assembly factor BamA
MRLIAVLALFCMMPFGVFFAIVDSNITESVPLTVKSIEFNSGGIRGDYFSLLTNSFPVRKTHVWDSITEQKVMGFLTNCGPTIDYFFMPPYCLKGLDYLVTTNGNSVDLFVTFHPFPVVEKFDLIAIEKIKQLLNSEFMYPAYDSPDSEKRTVDIVMRYLSNNLHPLAQVKLSFVQTGNNSVAGSMVINEGPEVKVKSVEIYGGESSVNQLALSLISNQPAGFLIPTGQFWADQWPLDLGMVSNYFWKKGFLDVQITNSSVQILTQQNEISFNLAINMSIGKRYRITGIEVVSNSILSTENILELTELNSVYDDYLLRLDYVIQNICNNYIDEGYPLVRIKYFIKKDSSTQNAKLILMFNEGEKCRLGAIKVAEIGKTKQSVILREVGIQPGQEIRLETIDRACRRLSRTGWFSSVGCSFTNGSIPGTADMILRTVDQRTGLVNFGVNYDAVAGYNGNITVVEKNFLGMGHQLELEGIYGQYLQKIAGSYTYTWVFGFPLDFGVELGWYHQLQTNIPVDNNNDGIVDGTSISYVGNTNYDMLLAVTNGGGSLASDNLYGGFKIGLHFLNDFKLFTSFKMYLSSFTGVGLENPLEYTPYGWEPSLSLMALATNKNCFRNDWILGVGYDMTDNIFPKNGYRVMLSAKASGFLLPGFSRFFEPAFNLSGYITPLGGITFKGFAESAVITPLPGDSAPSLTLAESTHFDGVYFLRGWLDEPDFGFSETYASGEILIPLYKDILKIGIFGDIGKIGYSVSDWLGVSNGYRASFGIGINVDIPMLPIRMYFCRLAYQDNLGEWNLTSNPNLLSDIRLVFSIYGTY